MSETTINIVLQVGGGVIGGLMIGYWFVKRKLKKDDKTITPVT